MSIALILSYVTLGILLAVLFNCNFLTIVRIAKQSWKRKYLKQGSNKKAVWQIPGPLYVPFVGTKWIFFHRYKISKLHEAYADLNQKYGQIVREVTPSGIPIVHLFDRQDIEKVLRYPSKHPFRPPTEIVVLYRKSRPDRYASIGITNEQGESWHNLRSKLTPHITSPRILQAFLPTLNSICDDFIELLRVKRDPETFKLSDFQDYANLMGLEAVCALMLGTRLGFLSSGIHENDTIATLACAVKQLFISERDSYYGMGLWRYLPTKTYKDFSKSEEIIYNVISKLVDDTLAARELECSEDDVRSVFLKILQTEDLDIRDKKSAIIDFIAAGTETVANTLSFILFYLSQHKHVKDRIYSEFAHTDGNIVQEDLSRAVFAKAFLQETYRIHPTAFCLARILEEETVLSGYNLKAGTVVICQTMVACRREENFKDANTFRPERWLQDNKNSRTEVGANIVVPFGTGKRSCPGKRFVEMELILLIAKLSVAFDIDFDGILETDCEFILAPKTPVNLIVKDRK